MKAAKTEALKGFAMGPMTLRPFAGEGLVAVGEGFLKRVEDGGVEVDGGLG
ncbi:hypothetical protein TthAA37_21770 (plasmid) [Thermus thermophilus]|uniref:Uncharacterized protein n=1 Tax=Thermus thermophilus TaxID=274 RepID=A0AAD1NZH4_THETH|nr:hypothetical protein [Thermus thermophilus]BBL83382.1 hypothetical protein TthAA220_21660 [Thermus thermophilus]BBL85655.1 hypothetical protein TthAA229_21360 [Thermus thermophilus]BCZ87985.1 hypothetical protein TthAA11_21670 [Thermus thermophilus]BCZ90384.1 hypothetical protein TthAA22_21890 [Thermus thermophilus]BCZ92988.1 hypothetical protein TthAA37_21770 [Thermus thermophilus]